VQAAPGLARIVASAWWHSAEWTVGTSLRTGRRALDAAVTGQSGNDLLQELGGEVREGARRLLGLMDTGGGEGEDAPPGETRERGARAVSEHLLRERGAALLRQSADVTYEEDAHPAYGRILGELAPDEGRILRFLAIEGPQPAVDIRSNNTLMIGSQLVAPGLTMIGPQSGTRYLDRVPAYLNNLYRLGLIWFSREALEDPLEYQVLEAQPDVIEAMAQAGRSKTVRRSIHLTPFGEDFCRVCLPMDVTGEMDALPRVDEEGDVEVEAE
jgi:hypothetical protein